MKYPEDWFNITDETYVPGEYEVFAFSNKVSGVNEKDVESVELQISPAYYDMWLFKKLQDTKVNGQVSVPPSAIYIKIQDLTVGGYPAVRYKDPNPPFIPIGDFVLVNRENRLTRFVLMGGSPEAVNKYRYSFDQILSTFKFTP